MQTLQFKTNIKCDGCIATVTSVLDQSVGAGSWSVDLTNPLRILYIADGKADPATIKAGLAAVGYQADEVEG